MMNRRSFFGAVAVLPVVAVAAVARPVAGGLRVSDVKGDPGELLYGKAYIDFQTYHVYLDGVEQVWWHTADEAAGFVVRDAKSPDGSPAHNPFTGEWVQETMRGKVEIVFDDKAWLAEALKPSVA